MNLEQRFFDALSDITGSRYVYEAPVEKVAEVAAEPESEAAQPMTKISEMNLADIVEHEAFIAGFEARLAERSGEIDAATADYLEATLAE
jgi:hypothetical protein